MVDATYVGAIDQGTTGTRFMVFDHAGAPVARAYREHRQIFPQAGWVEQGVSSRTAPTHTLLKSEQ